VVGKMKHTWNRIGMALPSLTRKKQTWTWSTCHHHIKILWFSSAQFWQRYHT
jgi:hypothetical protein